MKVLVDMNLSPEWLTALGEAGVDAAHWRDLGAGSASDREIVARARRENWVLLTQDLDVAQILFETWAGSPSVVLLRTREGLDRDQQRRVCRVVVQATAALEAGALLVIDERRVRLRRLPIA